MANQEPLSFEDLEPESEDIEIPNDLGNMDEFDNEDLDEFSLGTLSEYEFGDLQEEHEDLNLEGDEFSGNRRRVSPRRSLASLAALTVLKGNGRTKAASSFRGNGRRPVAPKRARGPVGLFGDEYLPETEESLLASASAVLLEDYELMEALAAEAIVADDEVEAELLIAATVPLAIRLAPTVYRLLWPVIPELINGAASVSRLLYRRSTTRPLIRMIPTILYRAITQLARLAAHGRPVTGRVASKILAKQTALALRRQQRTQPARRSAQAKHRRDQRPFNPYGLEEDGGYGHDA